ncbi:MAG: hypothetical protein RBQ97_07045, partial [Acholeplasma sp.]|nr:hypothetical protein [Acholeplasma sp.]
MKLKKSLLMFVLFIGILPVISCSKTETPTSVTVVDMVGDSVEVPINPKKVAVIARAAADMMIGFGLSEYVDGIYYSVLTNPWVELISPALNDLYSYDYNESAELFISRGVDLVIAPEKYIADDLRAAGVTAITVSLYGTPSYDSYLYYFSDMIKEIWP